MPSSPMEDKLHSSERATASGRSSSSSNKFTYWSHWSNMNKLGGFKPDSGSSEPCRSDLHHHHHLTSENLESHNKVHASLPPGAHVNGYIISTAQERCSPYYRGLTDSTLVLNRERSSSGGAHPQIMISPGGDSSIITSTTTISTTLSTLAVKMHQLTTSCTKFACGMFVSSDNDRHQRPATAVPKKKEKLLMSAKDVDDVVGVDSDDDQKMMNNNGHDEKPLREREVRRQKPLRERMNNSSDVGNKEGGDDDDDEKRMMIQSRRYKWADMYRPKKLEDFICNKSKAVWLREKVKELGDCGHLIFQGPAGVGKTTMILALLREAFGDGKIQVISEFKEINLEGEALGRIKVRLKKSAQHYEIKVSDLKGYEKHVIVELMKETQMLNATDPTNCECRAIVLLEADRLGTDTLMYIKWLLEKYKGKNKVLFSCSDVSKLHPLMPLCSLVHLLQPSRKETVEVLEFIAGREGIELSRKMAEKITDKSNNNLRQAIRSFEATWNARHVMDEEQEPLTGWEDDIANIAKSIIDERTPRQLYVIRGKLQNLIDHQVSPEFIFQFLVRELKRHLPDSMHAQLDCLYAEYTRDDKNIFNREKLLNGCRNGAAEENGKALHDHDAVPNSALMIKNNIYHFLRIEEFSAKFMSWYNYQSRMSD